MSKQSRFSLCVAAVLFSLGLTLHFLSSTGLGLIFVGAGIFLLTLWNLLESKPSKSSNRAPIITIKGTSANQG